PGQSGSGVLGTPAGAATPATARGALTLVVALVRVLAGVLGAVGLGSRLRLGSRSVLGLDDLDRDQGELPAVVDLADLDLDLLADADHVVEVLDALAAVQLTDLRDVQQTVLAGQQRDERTEGG